MKERITGKAVVVSAEGGMARVKLVGGGTCRRCGIAALGLCKPGGTGMLVEVHNPAGALPGETVRLALDKRTQWKGYLHAYILPLASFVTGGFMGHETGADGLAPLLAFFCLSASLAYSLRKIRSMDRARRMHVKEIIRDVPDFELQDGVVEGLDYLRAYTR